MRHHEIMNHVRKITTQFYYSNSFSSHLLHSLISLQIGQKSTHLHWAVEQSAAHARNHIAHGNNGWKLLLLGVICQLGDSSGSSQSGDIWYAIDIFLLSFCLVFSSILSFPLFDIKMFSQSETTKFLMLHSFSSFLVPFSPFSWHHMEECSRKPIGYRWRRLCGEMCCHS